MRNMDYRIVATKKWLDTYHQCIDYILCEFGDVDVARKLEADVEYVLDMLASMPESFPVCESSRLRKRAVRKVHLRRLDYKVFYRIVEEDGVVVLLSLIHDKQDFENIVGRGKD